MSEDFWSGRRVLITGMAGFVGAHLAHRLADLGADLLGLDRVLSRVLSSAGLRVLGLAKVPMLWRDVRDPGRLAWALSHGNGERDWKMPEVVFHLAGVGHIAQAQADPLAAWEVNVQGTWNLLEACHQLPADQIRAIVCASSNHVFGSLPRANRPAGSEYPALRQDGARTAWLEDDQPGQPDVYGTSKAQVDLLVRSYGAMGLPVASLRHVNCFGPADPHRSHLITGTICDLLENKTPVIRGDGSAIKGYLHVADVVSAYLLLAEAVAEGRADRGLAWHAAPSTAISVLALVELICDVTGHANLVPEILAEDLSQSGYVEFLNSARLRTLGWRLQWSLRSGIVDTWAWYRKHGGMAWSSP